MKQRRVSQEILQLTRLGLFNCYLVREEDGFTLVDTMLVGSGEKILAAAAKAGAPIRRILLTHSHSDHTGSLDALRAKTGAEVAISERESRLLAGDKSLDPGEPQTKVRGSFKKVKTRPDVLLRAGDTYGSLQALTTPGHTPGHFCFFDPRSKTLLAGDALASVRTLRVVSDAPWYFPLPRVATWNAGLSVQSASALADLDLRQIACGHGRLITDGTRALAAALARLPQKMR